MFEWILQLLNLKKEQEIEYTLENADLDDSQKGTAIKVMRVLNLEGKEDEITKQELVVMLYAVGMNPTEDVLDAKLRDMKLHKVQYMTLGHFAHIWAAMLKDLTDEEEILRRAFFFFDKDGNGEISVQELKTTMHELGDLLTEDEINLFMSIMDVNNDGVIALDEFLETLRTHTPSLGKKNTREIKQDTEAEAQAMSMSITSIVDDMDASVVSASPRMVMAPHGPPPAPPVSQRAHMQAVEVWDMQQAVSEATGNDSSGGSGSAMQRGLYRNTSSASHNSSGQAPRAAPPSPLAAGRVASPAASHAGSARNPSPVASAASRLGSPGSALSLPGTAAAASADRLDAAAAGQEAQMLDLAAAGAYVCADVVNGGKSSSSQLAAAAVGAAPPRPGSSAGRQDSGAGMGPGLWDGPYALMPGDASTSPPSAARRRSAADCEA